jgi:hypothetical protein
LRYKDEKTASDPLKPNATLLIKLGSIIVHLEEFVSVNGHPLDKQTAYQLLADEEVSAWLQEMTKRAFLPVKR